MMRILTMLLVVLASAMPARPADPHVFAYFKEPASQGIYLALSRDGYNFEPLNNGQPWIKPEHAGELMRDVFITRNPDGDGFRMVWTWNWRGDSLGYATSKDLVTWSEQPEIPIMRDFPAVNNVWAPELYWDESTKTGSLSGLRPSRTTPTATEYGLRIRKTSSRSRSQRSSSILDSS